MHGEPVGNGVWMAVSDRAVELFVPRLFGDRPIALSPAELAVNLADELDESRELPGLRPLAIVCLTKGHAPSNVMLVRAGPGYFPPLRRRAHLTAEGFVFQRSRDRPHDAYHFHADDPQRVTELLTRHGVERTTHPAAWAAARR